MNRALDKNPQMSTVYRLTKDFGEPAPEHLPKLLINRAAENNSMMHVIDEHLLDLAANRVRSLSQVTN